MAYPSESERRVRPLKNLGLEKIEAQKKTLERVKNQSRPRHQERRSVNQAGLPRVAGGAWSGALEEQEESGQAWDRCSGVHKTSVEARDGDPID